LDLPENFMADSPCQRAQIIRGCNPRIRLDRPDLTVGLEVIQELVKKQKKTHPQKLGN
jgi:hypothetical protein